MSLSSNSIIHFTKSLANLNGILKSGFSVKYCRETIVTRKRNFDFLIPIVSFCDIPFSQITNHINNYGCYGIGLKKTWAEKHGLNPVLYVEKESNLSDVFFGHIYNVHAGPDKSLKKLSLKEKYNYDVFRYLKNYQSDLQRNGKKLMKNYRFSDEREWRHVLDINSPELMLANLKDVKPTLVQEAKKMLNELIKNEVLIFEPEDINYIIIKKESERDNIIRNLENIKGKFPMEQVKRLTSRILSAEQIRSDF